MGERKHKTVPWQIYHLWMNWVSASVTIFDLLRLDVSKRICDSHDPELLLEHSFLTYSVPLCRVSWSTLSNRSSTSFVCKNITCFALQSRFESFSRPFKQMVSSSSMKGGLLVVFDISLLLVIHFESCGKLSICLVRNNYLFCLVDIFCFERAPSFCIIHHALRIEVSALFEAAFLSSVK